MADVQSICPANEDIENAAQISPRANTPLAPKSSLMSEKGDPAANGDQLTDFIFPIEQMVPTLEPRRYYPGAPRRRRNICCRCLVWTFCFLLLFLVVIAIAAAILYAIFSR